MSSLRDVNTLRLAVSDDGVLSATLDGVDLPYVRSVTLGDAAAGTVVVAMSFIARVEGEAAAIAAWGGVHARSRARAVEVNEVEYQKQLAALAAATDAAAR